MCYICYVFKMFMSCVLRFPFQSPPLWFWLQCCLVCEALYTIAGTNHLSCSLLSCSYHPSFPLLKASCMACSHPGESVSPHFHFLVWTCFFPLSWKFCCSVFCVSFLKCSFSHIKLLQSYPFKSFSMRLKGISPYSSILIYHLILLLRRSLCVAWLYVFQIMSASHRMDFTFLEDFLSMLTYVTVFSEFSIHVNDLLQLVNSNLASWFYQFLSPLWIQGPYRISVP